MAGLLDPTTAALLSAGLGILQNNRSTNPMQAIGAGGLQGLQAYQSAALAQQKAKDEEIDRKVKMMQLSELMRKQQIEADLRKAAQDSVMSPEQQALKLGGGPTNAAAQMIPNLKPSFDMQGYIGKAFGIDPIQAIELQKAQLPKTTTVKSDESIYQTMPDGTMKLVLSGTPKDDKPTSLREYMAARQDPEFAAFLDRQSKAKGTNISVNTGEAFGTATAKAMSERLMGQVAAADAAPGQMQAASQVLTALNSGGVMAGPGTKYKVVAQQLFGNDAQKLESTRSAIQGLAELALQSRKSLAGQGPITEGEQKLLQTARSGSIDELTVTEIRLIADGAMRNAQSTYAQGKRAAEVLKGMPGMGNFGPALDLPGMPTYKPNLSLQQQAAEILKNRERK